jgi:hypothetical protein
LFFGGIDIAVGRMLVSSPKQAEEMVNKVIEYHDKILWQLEKQFVMISDDSDQTSDASLQKDKKQFIDKITTKKTSLMSTKS